MYGRLTCTLAVLALAGSVAAAPGAAQDRSDASSILTADETRELVTRRAEGAAERRAALGAFLEQPAVRDAAEGAGIDIRRVESAAATLTDAEIERLEPHLRNAEKALAGGDTLVIGSTTVIIALLIIILIIVA